MNIGVVLAGGCGVRFGAALPKQYQKINGKDVIQYVIESFRKSHNIDDVFVVAHKDYVDYVQESFDVVAIPGGVERNETVFNALEHIRKRYPSCRNVVFADSARPLLMPSNIDEICDLLQKHEALITVAKITDSLGYKDGTILDRKDYFLIQTPEAFRIECLSNFNADSKATAIVQQYKGNDVYYYDGITNNLKITYPSDLAVAKVLLEEKL